METHARYGEDSLASVYRSYRSQLRRQLRNRFGCRQSPLVCGVDAGSLDVDDLIQEVFERLLLGRGSALLPGRDPGPYMFRIACNLYVDALRRGRARSLTTPAPEADSSEALEREHEVALLNDYAANLPHELSSVYEARFVRGLSQRDAAMDLGTTRRQIRTLEERILVGAKRRLQT